MQCKLLLLLLSFVLVGCGGCAVATKGPTKPKEAPPIIIQTPFVIVAPSADDEPPPPAPQEKDFTYNL